MREGLDPAIGVDDRVPPRRTGWRAV